MRTIVAKYAKMITSLLWTAAQVMLHTFLLIMKNCLDYSRIWSHSLTVKKNLLSILLLKVLSYISCWHIFILLLMETVEHPAHSFIGICSKMITGLWSICQYHVSYIKQSNHTRKHIFVQ